MGKLSHSPNIQKKRSFAEGEIFGRFEKPAGQGLPLMEWIQKKENPK